MNDWFVDTPVDLPVEEARLRSRAKAVYSAWIVTSAIHAVRYLNVGQSDSAAGHGVGFTRRRFFRDAVYRRGGPAFIIANIHNLTAISLVVFISEIETGHSPFKLNGRLYLTLAEWVSRWVQWVISVASAAFSCH